VRNIHKLKIKLNYTTAQLHRSLKHEFTPGPWGLVFPVGNVLPVDWVLRDFLRWSQRHQGWSWCWSWRWGLIQCSLPAGWGSRSTTLGWRWVVGGAGS